MDYARAIKRLATYKWREPADLVRIMAVIRGPDKDDHNDSLKLAYTGPLRIYLLGPEACTEAGYYPSPFNMPCPRKLPEMPSTDVHDHFTGHIYSALNVIQRNNLPPAEGW